LIIRPLTLGGRLSTFLIGYSRVSKLGSTNDGIGEYQSIQSSSILSDLANGPMNRRGQMTPYWIHHCSFPTWHIRGGKRKLWRTGVPRT